MKKRIFSFILTLVVWFILFCVMLPPINIQSKEFWEFCIIAVVAAVVIHMWSVVKTILFDRASIQKKQGFGRFKLIVGIIAVFVVIYIGGNLLSSPILRAKSYRGLLPVESGEFKKDIKEVDYSQIPILDKDSAAKLAEREMGTMVDMVSQYEVSEYYNQINYQSKPMRVTPLRYANEIKWLTNRKTGIPAYIRIDMTTQDVELVKLEQGMKYSPFEHFGRNLNRYLRFQYPTAMFRGFNFEINEDGTTYWICPVAEHTIGLFGGTDIKGAIVVNAVTGENQYYNVEDVPQWIDKIYDAELLVDQYDYYGTLKNGFINSIFGQRDCLQTTEGYNYIALNDDVWVYTGVTSVTGDQSNVGFVLMNQRTKETKYYQISGAKEISAMSSAEGQVQNLQYKATFPLLLNVAGEPTYFLALKDSAGLVKKYAMVNIQKYQIVAIGNTVGECEKAYRALMNNSGINTLDVSKRQKIRGTITAIKDIVIDGNTIYYIMIEGSNYLFEISVKDDISVLKKNIGDVVEIEYIESITKGVNTIISVK